jgi:hypothetical protein
MPEFETVSVKEAEFRSQSGRRGKFMNEYTDYIQQLPPEQAGKLHPEWNEKPAAIRRRLTQAAQVLGMQLVIKRSGEDVYFWKEDGTDEQPRSKRKYTRRTRQGRAGDYFPPQPFIEPELGEQGVPKEESPELGQLAAEAERRVEQS